MDRGEYFKSTQLDHAYSPYNIGIHRKRESENSLSCLTEADE